MKKNKKVSVILNCRNGENFLRQAIKSVYQQTWNSWEIIFWDNASTDSSAKIAKSFDERVKYYHSKKPEPLYVARQLALQKCDGYFVCFLDVDDYWHENKLEKQLEAFSKNSEAVLIATNAKKIVSNKITKLLYQKKAFNPTRTFSDLLNKYDLVFSSVMVKLDTLREIGGFDPNFPFLGDKDLILRLSSVGVIRVIDEPLTFLRIHDDSLTSRHFEVFGNENTRLIIKIIVSEQSYYQENFHKLLPMIDKICVQNAVASWKNGSGRDARKWLSRYFRVRPLLLFFISFLPKNVYRLASTFYRSR